jgi:hypothetical protein
MGLADASSPQAIDPSTKPEMREFFDEMAFDFGRGLIGYQNINRLQLLVGVHLACVAACGGECGRRLPEECLQRYGQ